MSNKYYATQAKKYSFAKELNSTARQASSEHAWSAISRFYGNCQKKTLGKKNRWSCICSDKPI